jgi:hypothetical protein
VEAVLDNVAAYLVSAVAAVDTAVHNAVPESGAVPDGTLCTATVPEEEAVLYLTEIESTTHFAGAVQKVDV